MDPLYDVDVKEGQILWADLNVMQKSDDQALQMVHFDKRLCIFKTGTFKIRFKTDFLCLQPWHLCSCFTTKAFLLSVMSASQNEVTVCVITPKRALNWN